MYLIYLSCSCQIELSPAHACPVFHQAKNCLDEHSRVQPYLNSRIARIQDFPSADEAIAVFDFDGDEELTGREIFH